MMTAAKESSRFHVMKTLFSYILYMVSYTSVGLQHHLNIIRTSKICLVGNKMKKEGFEKSFLILTKALYRKMLTINSFTFIFRL